uniref:CCHC-type domain-containing protein n=1 Tax=Daphnia galeata TaxID=27404 RepID=A0A8J2S6X0_9CRUS|nr:unnamed protein product [Daphnia galeata]
MSQESHPPTERQRNPDQHITPVIIHFNDGDIVSKISRYLNAKPYDMKSSQQQAAQCTVPNSSLANKNGVIFRVPINEHIRRHTRSTKGSGCHLITTPILDRVIIASMCFRVQISVPNPYRCSKCGRLEHTTSRCNSNQQACWKCNKPHPPSQTCSTHCINCNSGSHEFGDIQCPAYKVMKNIIKMAYLEGITIEEARARQQHIALGLSRRPTLGHQSQTNSIQEAEITALRDQLKALKEEIRLAKEAKIPKIDRKITDIAKDLASTIKNRSPTSNQDLTASKNSRNNEAAAVPPELEALRQQSADLDDQFDTSQASSSCSLIGDDVPRISNNYRLGRPNSGSRNGNSCSNPVCGWITNSFSARILTKQFCSDSGDGKKLERKGFLDTLNGSGLYGSSEDVILEKQLGFEGIFGGQENEISKKRSTNNRGRHSIPMCLQRLTLIDRGKPSFNIFE